MPTTRLIFTRHGETDWNAGDRIQGHSDVEMNALGASQAEALAERLAGTRIEAIYTSDLSRALRTAEAVGRRLPDAAFIITPELRERNWGALEGLQWDEIRETRPEEAAAIRSGDPAFAPAGGESKLQVRGRIAAFLDSVVEKHPGGTALTVTHGGVCVMIFRIILGLDLALKVPFHVDNCSINIIDCENGSRIVKTLNCTCHLPD
jgi:broad specificity phosphatase PhoE